MAATYDIDSGVSVLMLCTLQYHWVTIRSNLQTLSATAIRSSFQQRKKRHIKNDHITSNTIRRLSVNSVVFHDAFSKKNSFEKIRTKQQSTED